VGPHFQPMFQIRCKCVQKWPSYGQKCGFQFGGRRHLGFCWIRVLRVNAVQGPYSRCLYQIWCESVQKWRSYGRLTDTAIMAITRPADKMRFVQIGDLRHDLHLSIFPCLVSDRRSEPIINLILGTRRLGLLAT